MDENVQRAPETNVQRLQVSKRQHEKDVKRKPKESESTIEFTLNLVSCPESQPQGDITRQTQSNRGKNPGGGKMM